MAEERSYILANEAARERLRALAARLSDEQLARPIGHGWTVASALAHLAFWDHYGLGTLAALEQGKTRGANDPHAINDAALPLFLALPPRVAAELAIAVAEEIDGRVAVLDAGMVETIKASGHSRVLNRYLHRNEHLDEIERALG